MKMPFGKHKGLEVKNVPKSWLRWLVKERETNGPPLYDPLRVEVYAALGKTAPFLPPQPTLDEKIARAIKTYDPSKCKDVEELYPAVKSFNEQLDEMEGKEVVKRDKPTGEVGLSIRQKDTFNDNIS